MNWIRVTDRLPHDDEDYLALFIGWDDMEFMRVLDFEKSCGIWSDHNGLEYDTVTHWMPLPEAPE